MNRDDCRREILDIANKYKKYSDDDFLKGRLNRLIHFVSNDTFNDSSHFILELIQNAEDNQYSLNKHPEVHFKLTRNDPTRTNNSKGALIVQNNENGFLLKDVMAICDVADSTKEKSRGYIGEKGIGFKSVFKITSCPYIISNGYCFSLPENDEETGFGYIVPKWCVYLNEFENYNGTTIILPLDKQDYTYEKMESKLDDFKAITILFLSKINKIIIETDSNDNFYIFKDDGEKPIVQLYIDGKRKGKNFPHDVRKFICFSEIFDKPKEIEQDNRKDIDKREVIIAYPLNNLINVKGQVFAYLPTSYNSNLPFIINADFILTSGRTEIKGIDNKSDCLWNAWLWECVADCTANSLKILAEKDLLTVEMLNSLFTPLNQLERNSVLYPFFTKCKTAFIKQKLFKTDTGFASADEALLLGSAGLIKLFDNTEITKQLFGREHWLNKVITTGSRKLIGLYDFLNDKDKLNIPNVDRNRFLDVIDGNFLTKRSDEWIIKFYYYLKENDSSSIIDKVKNKPIIRAIKAGKQVQIVPDNVYISHESNIETSVAIVKSDLIRDLELEEFLINRLGIRIINEVVGIIENLIPKYKSKYINISTEEHLNDIRKIISAYKIGTTDEKNKLISEMQNANIILTENIIGKYIGYKKPEEVYFRNKNLSIYFAFNETTFFISNEYDDFMIELFYKLGVNNDIKIIRKMSDKQNYVVIMSSHSNHKRGINNFDPDISIDGLENNFNIFDKTNIVQISKDKLILFSSYVLKHTHFFLHYEENYMKLIFYVYVIIMQLNFYLQMKKN